MLFCFSAAGGLVVSVAFSAIFGICFYEGFTGMTDDEASKTERFLAGMGFLISSLMFVGVVSFAFALISKHLCK